MKKNLLLLLSFCLFLTFQSTAQIDVNSPWTWVDGDNIPDQYGVYGTQGVPGGGSSPGGRWGAATWTDSEGNLWLMGGEGRGSVNFGWLNDLWKYNPSSNKWTWMKGSTDPYTLGIYGTKGIPSVNNTPGGRHFAASWVDAQGKFWYFGGYGYATNGMGYFNDLWNYNPATNEWTWVDGDNIVNVPGAYGTQGIPSLTNKPGGREHVIVWVDSGGIFWMFGGSGYSATGYGYLNDLWKYDPDTHLWTWVKGDNTFYPAGEYGTKGVSDVNNKPGGRWGGTGWSDGNGKFWMMGGQEYNATDGHYYVNDLWRYDPATNEWTWIKGDNSKNQAGIYGTQGIPAVENNPGARTVGISWTGSDGRFWLMGGHGYSADGDYVYLNDLWVYDPLTDNWMWAGGNTSVNATGEYGIQGITTPTNQPGAREEGMSWRDKNGLFWLMGGNIDQSGEVRMNDLWKHDPESNLWTWMKGSTIPDQPGMYGEPGVTGGAKPGARDSYISWTSPDGMMWLFGGFGYAESGPSGYLNDLWNYNPYTNEWTWVKGDKSINQHGIYGTKGISSLTNNPGGRYLSVGWISNDGNLWLVGGNGYSSEGLANYLSDIWRFNPVTNEWTWIHGSNVTNAAAVYGTKGTASPDNTPGARQAATSWTDANGDFWLMGGFRSGPVGSAYWLNDLWKYNIVTNEWIWVKGDNSFNVEGVYGSIGVSSPSNKPGARSSAVSWTDRDGKLWLMGGNASISGLNALMNDLWRYDPVSNEWTWIKGSVVPNPTVKLQGIYGIKGEPGPDNTPGARRSAFTWTDKEGKLWLFGGSGFGTSNTDGALNDLWKFDPETNLWTWVKGENTVRQLTDYGVKGTMSPANKLGGRYNAKAWITPDGKVWFFGGTGYTASILGIYLNDLWSLTPTTNTYYKDADGDGYGNPNESRQANYIPDGYLRDNKDCDDAKAAVNPGASEICQNGIDDNCNGQIDEGCPPVELPRIIIRNTWVVEGHSGTRDAVFVLRLNSRYPLPVSVDFETVDGSARAPGDYLSRSGTVTFPPNTLQQTITIPVNGDLTREENEIFRVRLSNPVNAELGDERAFGVIINDERRPGVRVDDAWVRESDRRVKVKIRLTGPTEEWVTVRFETKNGTAKAPHDYEAIKNGRLRFRPGETEKWVQTEIKEDNRLEPTEYFEFRIKDADNASLDCSWGARPEARIYIVNSSSNNTRTISGEGDTDLRLPLEVKVLPNPATGYFTLNISSNSRIPIQLRVTDISGRLIEDRKLEGGVQRLQIGDRWINGTYFMEVREGDERKVVQLVKLK